MLLVCVPVHAVGVLEGAAQLALSVTADPSESRAAAGAEQLTGL